MLASLDARAQSIPIAGSSPMPCSGAISTAPSTMPTNVLRGSSGGRPRAASLRRRSCARQPALLPLSLPTSPQRGLASTALSRGLSKAFEPLIWQPQRYRCGLKSSKTHFAGSGCIELMRRPPSITDRRPQARGGAIENCMTLSTYHPHPHSLMGNEGSEGSFGVQKEPSNYPHEGNEGASRNGGNRSKLVAPKPVTHSIVPG